MSFNGVENAILDYAIGKLETQLKELGVIGPAEKAGLGNSRGIRYYTLEDGRLMAQKNDQPIEGLVAVNCYNFTSRGDPATNVREFLRWEENPAEYGGDFFNN
jgi:hypothetical protein